MLFQPKRIPYSQTDFYSKIVIDYLNNDAALQSFFLHKADRKGLEDAILARKKFNTNRDALSQAIKDQYANTQSSDKVNKNIELLKDENTFTITAAHQPNIFTGPLYFLYKILHAIKLAEACKNIFPEYNFIPVYYMGSEDADLDELGHIFINGHKLSWDTSQTGAVGRMLVDKKLLKLIDEISGQTGVQPYGGEIISLIKKHYREGVTIQDATFELVNELFGKFGLLVVIPDNSALKELAADIFSEELLNGHSSTLTEETGRQLEKAGYTPQAYSREINFFYLRNDSRSRIEKEDENWNVVETGLSFTREELLAELNEHPERFSPNVILRGPFQETILPNIAFIGGGGELAYWLQLKSLFEFYRVPYPLLVLRNSFLIVDEKNAQLQNKLGFTDEQIFQTRQKLQTDWVQKNTSHNLDISQTTDAITHLYKSLSDQAGVIDPTLLKHIESLKTAATKGVTSAGKKMLRAEKRNHDAAMRQIEKLKNKLFPNNNLQERIDNFIPWYAQYGPDFLNELYKNSLSLEQEFIVLNES